MRFVVIEDNGQIMAEMRHDDKVITIKDARKVYEVNSLFQDLVAAAFKAGQERGVAIERS